MNSLLLKALSAPVAVGVDVTFLLDDSGSMRTVENAVRRAYNRLLQEQQLVPGAATFTQAIFHGECEIGASLPLANAETLDDFKANGSGTAINDALGQCIQVTERRVPVGAQVVVVLFTDGQENASSRWTLPQVRELVVAKQQEGWKFIYVGANQNAQAEAAKYGIPPENALTFAQKVIGVSRAFRALSGNLLAFRQGSNQIGFCEGQRAEQRLLLPERTTT